MQTIKMKLGWLALLALLFLLYGRGNAHNPVQQIQVPVKGVAARAACDGSKRDGNWTFAITALSGKISKAEVHVIANANPTYVDGVPRLCHGYPEPDGRPQDPCGATSGTIEPAGGITIHKPRVGEQGTLSLPAGIYCVLPVVTGNGSVTVSVLHP